MHSPYELFWTGLLEPVLTPPLGLEILKNGIGLLGLAPRASLFLVPVHVTSAKISPVKPLALKTHQKVRLFMRRYRPWLRFGLVVIILADVGLQMAYAKTETPPGVSSFLETSSLARGFESQKNQIIPESAQLSFKIDSSQHANISLLNTKNPPLVHLFYVRGHFKAKWTNDPENGEEDSVAQIYDAAFVIFDGQKKAALLDQYFSEDACDGDHIVGYAGKYLFWKTKKEQVFFSLERKMKGDSCAGDTIIRNWVDSSIYLLKDTNLRKIYSFVAYDKKENLSFFPESDESYVSGLTYLRSDLTIEKNETKKRLDFLLKSVSLQGIEKPVTSKVMHRLTWDPNLESLEEAD